MFADDQLKCVIDKNKPTGTYKIYLIYCGVRLTQKVVTTYSGGSQTNQNRTITFVPDAGSKIISWTSGQ